MRAIVTIEMMFALLLRQTLGLIVLSIVLGGLRQLAPFGIDWFGKWPTEETSAKKAYEMLAKKGDPPFIGLAEVIDLQNKKSATILDARSSKLFNEGHIPAARNLPYYELEEYEDAALSDLEAHSLIIIYCEGIGCELSFFLGRELMESGFENVRIFYGGYPEWENAGLPIGN